MKSLKQNEKRFRYSGSEKRYSSLGAAISAAQGAACRAIEPDEWTIYEWEDAIVRVTRNAHGVVFTSYERG